jgi:hypothetical protein
LQLSEPAALAPTTKRPRPRLDCAGLWAVCRLLGNVLGAGEAGHERSVLLSDLVADLEGPEDGHAPEEWFPEPVQVLRFKHGLFHKVSSPLVG